MTRSAGPDASPIDLALVTIGQAPRDDVTPDIAPLLREISFAWFGALDGMTAADLPAVAPAPDEPVLVSRLVGGGSVLLGERRIVPHVQAAIDRAARRGATGAVIMCTGELTGLHAPMPLYMAEQIARTAADGQAGAARLGVLVPKPQQRRDIEDRWRADHGRVVTTAAADPYTGSPGDWAAAARPLVDAGAQAIFLDCIGYSEAMADEIRSATGVEVYAARTMAVQGAIDRIDL